MQRSSSTADPRARGPRPAGPDEPRDRSGSSPDVLVAAGAMLAIGLATLVAPEDSLARLVVALPVLLVAPGYLLLQAVLVPARSPGTRAVHGIVSLGVSPAVVGLLALSTAIVPGGFREGSIVAVVTVACLVMAAVAVLRRRARRSGTTTVKEPQGGRTSQP